MVIFVLKDQDNQHNAQQVHIVMFNKNYVGPVQLDIIVKMDALFQFLVVLANIVNLEQVNVLTVQQVPLVLKVNQYLSNVHLVLTVL